MDIVAIAERRILEINEALRRRNDANRQAIMRTLTATPAYSVVLKDREALYLTLNADGHACGVWCRRSEMPATGLTKRSSKRSRWRT